MKLFLTFSLLLSILGSRAQDTARNISFAKVEVEAVFPGGQSAWIAFVNKNLHYPDEAMSNNIQGDVLVQFIVDKEGDVSDIQAVSGPKKGGLREEAMRIIRISGKWEPGTQNGHKVRSYLKQKISFKMV